MFEKLVVYTPPSSEDMQSVAGARVICLADSFLQATRCRPGWAVRVGTWLRALSPFPKEIYSAVSWQDQKMTCKNPTLWNVRVPVDPESSCQILLRDLPERTSVNLEAWDHGCKQINFSIRGPGFTDRRFAYSDSGTVDAGLMEVAQHAQRHGLGRKLMRNQIEFFFAAGFREFGIIAGLGVGGYAWARCGFLPTDTEGESFSVHARRYAQDRYDAIAPLLAPEERACVEPYLPLQKRRDIWALADSDIDLSSRLHTVFAKPLEGSADQRTIQSALRAEFQKRAAEGKRISLGQVLLVGSHWKGILDMTDPEQMTRVGQYVGGWKYIGILPR